MPSRDRPAPVLLLAYARPDHLRRTVESLRANDEAAATDLYVYCDAAKTSEVASAVAAVRRYVDQITGFASVMPVFRDRNWGLSASVIDGVTQLLERDDRVIVVEDDLVVSRFFLRYMNGGLDAYATDERVASIHGYSYPVSARLPETFFLRGADCWGWATWRRAWSVFESDGRKLLDELERRSLTRAFDLDGVAGFSQMLRAQVAGTKDSWAVRWHASCYLRSLLTLYPGQSLVDNIGNDGTGRHRGVTDAYRVQLRETAVKVGGIPVVESSEGRSAFKTFLGQKRSPLSRARNLLRRIVQRSS